MRWRDREGSDNVEDRREEGGGGFQFPFPGGGEGGSGRIRIPIGRGGGMGLFGLLAVVGVMLLLGIDPRILLQDGGGLSIPRGEDMPRLPGAGSQGREGTRNAAEDSRPAGGQGAGATDEQKQFVAVVLRTTEDVWKEKFRQSGRTYDEPRLVLYRGQVSSRCGQGSARMGPFYCPMDAKIYIDLSFYEELKRRFRAPGDFAQAYVIAHEVGHHVQTLLGITEKVEAAKGRASAFVGNKMQVRMELQADCLAGIWAHYAQNRFKIVEDGDIDEALTAAAAIGDDRIQRSTQGRAVPETFTHGSSEQRVRWFRRGFESGNFPRCDTFSTETL